VLLAPRYVDLLLHADPSKGEVFSNGHNVLEAKVLILDEHRRPDASFPQPRHTRPTSYRSTSTTYLHFLISRHPPPLVAGHSFMYVSTC
jgi:hypothetical protein